MKVFKTCDGYKFYKIKKGDSFLWVDSLTSKRVYLSFDTTGPEGLPGDYTSDEGDLLNAVWVMQIKNTDGEWKSVKPTGGDPYEYQTPEEASGMLQMCYPDACLLNRLGGDGGARIKEICGPLKIIEETKESS